MTTHQPNNNSNPNNKQPLNQASNKSLEKILCFLSYLSTLPTGGIVLLIGVGTMSIGIPNIVSGLPSSCLAGQQFVSLADYEKLELDMTITDVKADINFANEISRTKSAVSLEWRNCDGSSLTAVFDQGRLASMSQSGLR